MTSVGAAVSPFSRARPALMCGDLLCASRASWSAHSSTNVKCAASERFWNRSYTKHPASARVGSTYPVSTSRYGVDVFGLRPDVSNHMES